MARSWPFSCPESHQHPLALDNSAGPLPPAVVLPVRPSEAAVLGVGRAPVSLAQSPVGVGKVTQSPPS